MNEWYDIFGGVLQNIGLATSENLRLELLKNARSDRVRTEIVKVMATTLGPVDACASVVLALLVGHLKVDASQTGIKAFHALQKDALGPGNGRFEVVNVNLSEGGEYQIAMHGFQYDSRAAPEGILFSKVETDKLTLFYRRTKFGANVAVLETVSDMIAAKVSEYFAHHVFDIV
jgi:hypothetical protein